MHLAVVSLACVLGAAFLYLVLQAVRFLNYIFESSLCFALVAFVVMIGFHGTLVGETVLTDDTCQSIGDVMNRQYVYEATCRQLTVAPSPSKRPFSWALHGLIVIMGAEKDLNMPELKEGINEEEHGHLWLTLLDIVRDMHFVDLEEYEMATNCEKHCGPRERWFEWKENEGCDRKTCEGFRRERFPYENGWKDVKTDMRTFVNSLTCAIYLYGKRG